MSKAKTRPRSKAKARPAARPATVLVLRTCDDDERRGYGGFQWPESGPVEAPDWSPNASCGQGLHGLLWGEGNGSYMAMDSPKAAWLVVEVNPADGLVDLQDKVKFRRGVVVHCGDRKSATEYLAARSPGRAIAGGTATAGYRGTATAGDSGTATAGDRGTATAGDSGTATAGDRGTATAGDSGTATAGYRGAAAAGYRGTATAGEKGIIQIRWWDGKAERYRVSVGYVGEDGIEPTEYRLDAAGRFVKVAK